MSLIEENRTNFLTSEIAKQLSDQSEGNDLDLSFVENINPEVASIIAMHKGLVKGGAGMLILDGLVEGDKIIAEGLTKVRPGMKIKPIIK